MHGLLLPRDGGRGGCVVAVTGPLWARWVFALAFAGIGLHCATRLLRGRGSTPPAQQASQERDPWGDLAHLLMSVGMVVMFLPIPTPVPPAWWAALFGAQAIWLAARLLRPGNAAALPSGSPVFGTACRTHVISSVVMAGMFAVLPADGLTDTAGSHAGHLGASSHLAAAAGWTALAYFLSQSLVCGVRVAAPHPRQPPLTHSDGQLSVRLLMGLGMSYMLLTML